MSSGSGNAWLYKTAAIAAAATLTAGVGYVIYKYVLSESDEPDEPISMQALLTGGAAGGGSAPRASPPALPVRKTPPAPKPKTSGPSLPTRKSPSPKPAAPAATPAAAGDAAAAAVSAADDGAGPSTSAAPAAPAAKAPASAGLKACACCSQPLKTGGLPQRCGKCKSVYYCSQACQKKHWSEHKPHCSKGPGSAQEPATSGTSSSGGGDADSGDATAAAVAPAPVPAPAAEGASGAGAADSSAASTPAAPAEAAGAAASGSTEADASSSAAPAGDGAAASGGAASGGLQNALVEVLRQAAEKGAGTLDGAFEEAVMYFLDGKLATALSAFQTLQAAARAQGRSDLALDLHKWLGHTHTKMGDFGAAAQSFRDGIQAAKAAGPGSAAAQVDNAVGLGNLLKMMGKLTEATTVLKDALQVAAKAESAGMQPATRPTV
ncbi:hypothetical protein GPECTOR_25g430 [Gonium pectorale]|uniref:MYND-type domain-containing protein n=1 Tax=Gonium pectorale TaxID=33097 RepID=A0A150GGT8_GONPE|nr:hypothetical protein GPECTOR_25g430 [Gonium pectorale]|eukprot:KXZ48845.1 hypothetical protein GPECTOR_25g430 [Gonium pectorale]